MAPETPPTAPALAPFTSISAKAYEHPADRAATAVLHRLPFFDPLVKKLLELTIERRMMQLLLGNSVRLGETQLPRIWSAHRAAYTTLDIAGVPTLHIIQTPVANAVTIGAKRPTVLLQSGIVPMLDETELRAVLAHEAGHVLSEHVRYRTTLELLLRFTLPRLPLMGRVPLQALIAALLAWYRAAELSCDRAAAIALRDPLPTCRALMKLAGGGAAGLSLDAFIQQADEYIEWDDLFDRHQRLGPELGSTHPFPVRRVYELTRWVKSGEYDRIMAGDYVRRGEEPPPSAEFRQAVDHYTERFREFLERTAGGLDKMSRQFTRWLESFTNQPGGDDEG
ncbi:MAG: M48 family metallopeptidase [Candidatus Dormibacteria bacterium]|jgi:Zn-dependent protease with chaperone function